MEGKSTDDLRKELAGNNSIETYLKKNEAFFLRRCVPELLDELYAKRSITKAELARRAGMSEVYLHQLFSGRRKPSRDRLLCICVGLEATLAETQRLLEQATFAQLYPRIKREAIISYGLEHRMTLDEINDRLFTENEKTLC